jgi:hypothetical protein
MKPRHYIAAVLVIVIVGIYAQQARANIYGSTLMGWWTLDSNNISGTTATNSVVGGNNGTLMASPSASRGALGQAISFNGTTQHIKTASTTNLDLTNFTVSTWVKGNNNAGTSVITQFVNKASLNTAGQWINYTFTWDHTAAAYVGSFTFSWGSGVTYPVVKATTAPLANRWYHMVGTYDSANLKLYVDGKLNTTLAETHTPDTGEAPLYIGSGSGAAGTPAVYFPGVVDDVRIYNRAITAAEVMQLYQNGKGLHLNTF